MALLSISQLLLVSWAASVAVGGPTFLSHAHDAR
eukprot:CAMPEP_0194479338 /NCGR_PEP_ID=MMETSP0253-20130528/2503_1 /TAXON_ID=2966 /ORGANISM="Noctiluca scintillans" /LENGTH=33 /DNA_ID= /DNA_START= /DNA_END= /DNA_ORIENTATION=